MYFNFIAEVWEDGLFSAHRAVETLQAVCVVENSESQLPSGDNQHLPEGSKS